MRVRIPRSAIEDLARGREFYEKQMGGLGSYFLDTLYSDIDSLALYGGVHRRVFGYHRVVSNRFPYAIYYKVVEGVVEVWRVLDCRQNSTKTRQALQ